MLKQFFMLLTLAVCINLNAQVYLSPVFPNADEAVTLTFNPQEGDRGLATWTGDIYAHTGVTTPAGNWQNVKEPMWGSQNPLCRLTRQPNGTYTLAMTSIRAYYGVAAGVNITGICVVFHNGGGNASIKGAAVNGADIFYTDVVNASTPLRTRLVAPSVINQLTTRNATIPFNGAASQNSTLTLTDNGVQLATATNAKTLTHNIVVPNADGAHRLVFKAVLGTQSDSAVFNYVVVPTNQTAAQPAGTQLGANFNATGDSVTFVLHAPRKQNIFVIGSFNNWAINTDYQMKRGQDTMTWWLKVGGFTPNQVYTYQYIVDGSLTVADPLSTLILDPNNDSRISAETFPNMPAYPTGKATGAVSVIQPGKTPYVWRVPNFVRPEKKDLVIYELLTRDFVAKHNYQTLIDTIRYLKNLGVNAIQLMPISEFDNNESWGYNVTFHMALDKYYGTADKFKEFVDVCHQNGIAVISDVVFNHIWGGLPALPALYFENNGPSLDNPWLNRVAKHPYNVGFDMNHESPLTRMYTERNIRYWLTEFKLDGFRWDLSKGFTQFNSGTNEGLMSQYDASRIAIWKNYHNVTQATTAGAYTILEHFAEAREETELADAGMMVWTNVNGNYRNAAKGNSGNSMAWAAPRERGWTDAKHDKSVAYMESHDEDRVVFDALQAGNFTGDYSIRELPTALRRMELASAFFFTIPGPKMIWQFGELGYDFSINYNMGNGLNDCRLCNKPIRWDYLSNANRRRVYDVYRNLIHLKKTVDAFRGTDYDQTSLKAANWVVKDFHVNGATTKATILGNFGVEPFDIVPNFQNTGKWYEYLNGDSINVTNVTAPIRLLPGEYRVYLTQRITNLPAGNIRYPNATPEFADQVNEFGVYPTPSVSGKVFIGFNLKKGGLTNWQVFNLQGQMVAQSPKLDLSAGSHAQELGTTHLSAGTYLVKLTVNGVAATQKLIVAQ